MGCADAYLEWLGANLVERPDGPGTVEIVVPHPERGNEHLRILVRNEGEGVRLTAQRPIMERWIGETILRDHDAHLDEEGRIYVIAEGYQFGQRLHSLIYAAARADRLIRACRDRAVSTLIRNLRGLARYENNDFSLGEEAADFIEDVL
jgi:DNA-binding GntR family transcriptional regulator